MALLAGLVLVTVGPVFAKVGAATPQGLAYRAYFTADLFAHMSVVAELAHRHIPLLNPYLPTETLPYYWACFSLPAVFSGLRPDLGFDRGILQTDLALALVLVVVWYTAARALGPRRGPPGGRGPRQSPRPARRNRLPVAPGDSRPAAR